MADSHLKDFCNLYVLKNLIKKHVSWFKNPENPKTIDLTLTNRTRQNNFFFQMIHFALISSNEILEEDLTDSLDYPASRKKIY